MIALGQALFISGQACVWSGIALGRRHGDPIAGFSQLDFAEGLLLGCGIVLLIAATVLSVWALARWRQDARESA